MWVFVVPSPFAIAAIARIVGAPISDGAILIACLFFSLLFLLPAFRGWGAKVSRVAWTRAGFAVACCYIGMTIYTHHSALQRVRDFVVFEKIQPESIGALPFPPSLLNWDGLVRTSRGVYELQMDLTKKNPFVTTTGLEPASAAVPTIEYKYLPDAPPNAWIQRAKALPEVQKVFWFARFPVTRFHMENGDAVVEISDARFPRMRPDRPGGFTYRVRFDQAGNVLNKGWANR